MTKRCWMEDQLVKGMERFQQLKGLPNINGWGMMSQGNQYSMKST